MCIRDSNKAKFDKTTILNCSKIEPQVTWGTNPAMISDITGIVPNPKDFKDIEIEKELEKNSAKLANLEVLKRAFSTSGLIAYKIENLVKDLEGLTNDYLAELSDGRFSLGFVVTNDKLNVEITDNSKIVDILALSSGELARVNTYKLLAIRKLKIRISSSRINSLLLDEVIAVLDDQGREKVVEILLGEDLVALKVDQ